jgi:signal transduction histidine kinase
VRFCNKPAWSISGESRSTRGPKDNAYATPASSPSATNKGLPKYLLGISEDITDRKRIEKELAISLEETERASRGKSKFLANMSHELRSPLNSIIGFAQIMRDGYFGALDKRYTEYSTDIYSSASHLLELINEILDI